MSTQCLSFKQGRKLFEIHLEIKSGNVPDSES